MRRSALLLAAVLGLLFSAEARPQTSGFTTRAVKEFSNALTNAGRFGVPRYATAVLPACGATNRGAVAFDTTSLSLKICNGSTWNDSGGSSFIDTTFKVCDDGDQTKCINAGQLSGITTANTLSPFTYTGTAATPTTTTAATGNFIMAGTSGANINKYFCFNGTNYPCFIYATPDAPDILKIALDASSRGAAIVEAGDETSAMNHALSTHPWFYWHTSNISPVTEYSGVGAVGTRSELFKTLTESSATAIVQIPVAASDASSGILEYAIFAKDGTDQQLRESSIRYAVTNKAGTETCTITTMAGAAVTNETNDGNAASISAGTLTYAIACDTAPTNAVNITFNAVSSLTQTTLQARYQVRHRGASEPLPQ